MGLRSPNASDLYVDVEFLLFGARGLGFHFLTALGSHGAVAFFLRFAGLPGPWVGLGAQGGTEQHGFCKLHISLRVDVPK